MFTDKPAHLKSGDTQSSHISEYNSASSMEVTKILLANEVEQKKLYGKLTDLEGAEQSSAETEDFYSCLESV